VRFVLDFPFLKKKKLKKFMCLLEFVEILSKFYWFSPFFNQCISLDSFDKSLDTVCKSISCSTFQVFLLVTNKLEAANLTIDFLMYLFRMGHGHLLPQQPYKWGEMQF
jgi:hypothetical protein